MRTATRPGPSLRAVMVRSPRTIEADRSLADAHRLMREKGIRHLPVTRAGSLVGILSLRDLHLVKAFREVDPAKITVENAMTPNPFTVSPDAPLAGVARTMARNKWGCAVVIEEERVVGMFTTVDALRLLAELLEPEPRH